MSTINMQHQIDQPEEVVDDRLLSEVDQALKQERVQADKRLRTATEQENQSKSLPSLLRLAGAIVLIASAATFMLQEWSYLDHTSRYFSFLGFTAVLAACGFLCGIRMSDDKSARTFLAVAAAIVPVHFCQLGALIQSRFGVTSAQYPDWLTWTAPSDSAALLTAGVGVIALAPMIYIAFRALARPVSKVASLTYLAFNAVLLLPIRDPDLVGLLALILLPTIVLADLRVWRPHSAMKTLEGGFIRGMMFVPFMLLIGRTFHLYEMSFLLYAVLCEAAAVMLFIFVPQVVNDQEEMPAGKGPKEVGTAITIVSQAWGAVAAAAGWAFFAVHVAGHFDLPVRLAYPLLFLPAGAIIGSLSLYSVGSGRNYIRVAALICTASVLAQLFLLGDSFSNLICIAVAIIVAAIGHFLRDKTAFFSGSSAFVIGLMFNLRYAVKIYYLSPWLGLAIIGTLTVLAAASLEKYQRTLVQKASNLRNEIKTWQ